MGLRARNSLSFGAAALAISVMSGSLAMAESAPLERDILIFPGMSSSATLPAGGFLAATGQQQGNLSGSGGTGNQLYHHQLEYGLTDRVQIGATVQRFEDPVPIAGGNPDVGIRGISGQVAYKFLDTPNLRMTLRGSVEQYEFRSQFWNSRNDDERFIGSVHLPVTVRLNDALEIHGSAGVSVFPDAINGVQFYGVVPQVGIGASYRASERLSFYGLVNVPFGDNGNSISDSGAIRNVPVWAVGGSFNVTPKAALDLYVGNGLGATPATQILTFFPGGDDLVVGARLTYTPGQGPGYRPNYRGITGPTTKRQKRLALHSQIITPADTLDPGTVQIFGNYGQKEFGSGGFYFSPDHDIQVGVIVGRYANDGSVPATAFSSTGTQANIAAKLRFLDQNNGSPFSLSGNFVAGRDINSRVGSLLLSMPASYQFNDRFAVVAEPQFAASGNTRIRAMGFGANFELFDGFDLIGEAKVVDGGNGHVWSAGARYSLDAVPVTFDVQATNAIGNAGYGSVIAQDSTRFSAGFHIALDGKPIWNRLIGR